MSKVLVLGAGIAGHTAALIAKRKLGKKHDVIVVSPNSNYQWIPSNIWVGMGLMTPEQVKFELAPVYKRLGIEYRQAAAVSLHPEGDEHTGKGYVTIRYIANGNNEQEENIEYDFLINATGPKLNFAATEGLGPDKYTNSVCTYQHAGKAWEQLKVCFQKMEQGEKQRILVGTGHPYGHLPGSCF